MNYLHVESVKAFRRIAPPILEKFASELGSSLIELEDGFYEIEKNNFCLRFYYASGHRASIAVVLIPKKNQKLLLWESAGGLGIGAIMRYYGQRLRSGLPPI